MGTAMKIIIYRYKHVSVSSLTFILQDG